MTTKLAKRVALMMAVLLLSSAMAAFAGGEAEGGSDGQQVEITFWQHSYPPLNDWTEAQIDAFMEENPNVNVSFELIPFEEYIQKVFTSLATGQAPDVFETDDYTFQRFYENRVLGEITPERFGFDSAEEFQAAFRGNSLDLATVNGSVYAIPYDWEAPVIGYNISIFEDHGVRPEDIRTWKDLGEAAQLMAEKDENGVLTTAGMAFVHNIGEYYQHIGNNLFEAAGARILNEDGTQSAINSPEAEKVFQLWNDMIFKYEADDPGFTGSFYTEEFGNGRVAMGWMLTWANSILAPHDYVKGRDFDLMPVPTFEGGSTATVSNGWNFVVNADISDAKAEAAGALLRHLSDNGDSFLMEAGLINPRVGWRENVPAAELAKYDEIFESLSRSRPHHPHSKYQELWDPIIDVFQAVEVDPNPDIPELLETADNAINSILAE